MTTIRDVPLEALPGVTPEQAHALGLQAADWLASLTPGPQGTLTTPTGAIVPRDRLARAVRYQDTALSRWADSLPPGTGAHVDLSHGDCVTVGPRSEWARLVYGGK